VQRFIAKLDQASRVRRPATASRGNGTDHDPATPSPAVLTAGRLMYGAHRSYSRNCGLGSRETDLLVSLVRQLGPDSGLYGAKITGGGSGGTVAVLLAATGEGTPTAPARAALERVRADYAAATGRTAGLIVGSHPGAGELAPLALIW
jgi:galactokinase